MRAVSECPSERDLEHVVMGLLNDTQAQPIQDHLLTCESCVQKLETLQAEDDFVASLRRQPTSEKPSDDDRALIDDLVAKICARQADSISGAAGSTLANAGRGGETRERTGDTPASPGVGSVLGNYTLLQEIGRGGMGQVFLAEHRRMGRKVAIKTLPPETMKDPATVARFAREVEAAAKLRHPNIVAADDADEFQGIHFLVMEYVEGQVLSARVKECGPWPVAKAVDCIIQAAHGLEYAHKKGVVHRDVKPSNLLLDPEGRVKILDMGLARVEIRGPDVATQAELTATGMVMGTVDYMAPEQALNTRQADGRADIYSLGCTLFYLLTGSPVYKGDSVTARLLAHQTQPLPELRTLCGEVSPELDAVFKKMVAKKVEDRYQSMTEVITALQPWKSRQAGFSSVSLSSDTTKEHQPAVPRPAQDGTRRGLLALAAVASGSIALCSIIYFQTHRGLVIVGDTSPVDAEPIRRGEQQPSAAESKRPLAYQTPAFEQWMKDIVTMSAEKQVETVSKKLVELNPEFDGKIKGIRVGRPEQREKPHILNGMVTAIGFDSDHVTDISPVRALTGLQMLDCGGSGWKKGKLFDLSPLRGMQLTLLSCAETQISDLSPLKDMSLIYLNCGNTNIADLSPLTGMPLDTLGFANTNVSKLPLTKDVALTFLNCDSTLLTDLSSLNGRLLKDLYLNSMVADLTPLQEMPLERLWLDFNPLHEHDILRSIKTLGTINSTPTAMFCNAAEVYKLAAKEPRAFQTPGFDRWLTDVRTLTAEQQVEAVSQKLQELNPGFDGKVKSVVENDVVISLDFPTDNVTDISPVRALNDLKVLYCSRSIDSKQEVGGLSDISPLHGMRLTELRIRSTHVADLSPLSGMKLTALGCRNTNVSDLSTLKGMPLNQLDVSSTLVRDLSSLKGMPLASLWATKMAVRDYSPLQDTPVTFLSLSFDPERDTKILRSLTTLQTINDLPVAEFWRDIEGDPALPR